MPFHRISAHRIACLALYKAFLRHIPHLPYSNTVKKQARSAVWIRFRKDRRIQGLTNIRGALTTAYEQESLFRLAATGDAPSISTLAAALKAHKSLKKHHRLMSRAPSRPPPSFPPKQPPTLRKSRIKRAEAPLNPIASARRLKSITILHRRTPYLVATNNFPMLRRPGRRQSVKVAVVLKKKIRKRQQRTDLSAVLEDWIEVAKEEDMWDSRLWNCGLGAGAGVGPWEARYEPEAVAALRVVRGRMKAADERAAELTGCFRRIIEREGKRKEVRIANHKRLKRRRARYRARVREKVKREFPHLFKTAAVAVT